MENPELIAGTLRAPLQLPIDPVWATLKGKHYNSIKPTLCIDKAKATMETKLMTNQSLELHNEWLPLDLHRIYRLQKNVCRAI